MLRIVEKLWENMWGSLWESCGKVSTEFANGYIVCFNMRKFVRFFHVVGKFYRLISTEIWGSFSLLGGEICTVST